MNSVFKNNILSIYKNKGRKWLDDLPITINKIAKKWNLSNLNPVENLSINYVASGFQGKQEIILKISLDKDLILKERTALVELKKYGAVELIDFQDDALLLKKILPGTSLKTYLPTRKKEALSIACIVAKKIFEAPLLQNIKLPTIEERFSLLDRSWEIPGEYLIKAKEVRDEIFSSNSQRKVLHGDLHHDNILEDNESWKFIDPHGVIGLPINEVWAFIQDIEEDSLFVAKFFGFDPLMVRKSYFLHSLLSSIWAIEDRLDPKFFLSLASKASNLF